MARCKNCGFKSKPVKLVRIKAKELRSTIANSLIEVSMSVNEGMIDSLGLTAAQKAAVKHEAASYMRDARASTVQMLGAADDYNLAADWEAEGDWPSPEHEPLVYSIKNEGWTSKMYRALSLVLRNEAARLKKEKSGMQSSTRLFKVDEQ